jgi:prepilin-type processing-associated H-X9-DG protein
MQPHFSKRRNHALTLTEVLVVTGVLAILVTFLLPAFMAGSCNKCQKISCVNNLKQIGLAYRIWAGDNFDKYPTQVSVTNGGTRELFRNGSQFQNLAFLNYLVMSNELSTPRLLICPADTIHFAAKNFSDFNNRNISYFVGLDADTNHSQTFLSGDDNFEIGGAPIKSGLLEISTNTTISWTAARHKFVGNIALADGSVQQLTQTGLRQAFQQTGLATNRLAIP